MDHTYLRYECADSFGLAAASGSSKAPNSNSILAFLGNSSNSPVLTVAGSYCMGFNLRTCLPCLKIGHREHLTGGLGTGRALNSDELVCLDVSPGGETTKVATGWVDGAIRIFDIDAEETKKQPLGLVHSLIHTHEDDDFVEREPLSLNGHSQSPVRAICFEKANNSTGRLASGGSDGSVVLWDVIAETGLFRLLGHRGGITNVIFWQLPVQQLQNDKMDALITSSLDGLVKIWDLDGQCCTQTLANHRGEVWTAACMRIRPDADEDEDESRWRLVTGSIDGLVRVWSVQAPQRMKQTNTEEGGGGEEEGDTSSVTQEEKKSNNDAATTNNMDDTCHYMGCLLPPPNVLTSAEKITCVKFHPNGKHVGVLRANGKNVDVYIIRTAQESLRKKQRRLRRRQEKMKKKQTTNEENNNESKQGSKNKRGILDDPESSDDEENNSKEQQEEESLQLSPELVKASDEFEYFGTIRASHKVRGFAFVPSSKKTSTAKGGIRIVCALTTNELEVHSLSWKKEGDERPATATAEKTSALDMYGHPTGVRAVALSSDDVYACTVSKNVTKVWNVSNRSCIQSLNIPAPDSQKKKSGSCYGLCATFLPGNTHVVMGTREGILLIIDIAAGEVVYTEEEAHDGAIWSIDVRRPSMNVDSPVVIVTGSADKTVKMWDIESQEDSDDDDEDEEGGGNRFSNRSAAPMLVHTRTLQMTDEVVAVRYSHTTDPTKRFVFVSTLDCTVKVFFDDSLKLFLSLYGHKLPALAVDASDDDVLLGSSGADKTIKIWGLDFGDTHRTLHGHEDSVTDLRFVKRTHNFFTSSKDGTIRYWDGDRFEQILLLPGHFAEVCCLAVSRTGAFVLSGGMDRQVRVWERTKDIVFLEEERERELEQMFDRVDNRDEGGTAQILKKKRGGGDLDDDDDDEEKKADDDEPQSEAAVKRSVLSVASGDRIMEALELADQELKDIASFRKSQQGKSDKKQRSPNPLLLNLEPAQYVLWVLKSIKSSELEQSLLVLPLTHVERLMYYLIILLKSGRGIELCSNVAVNIVQTHQNQLIMNQSLVTPLRELRNLIRLRLGEVRDTVGYNRAALRLIGKVGKERKQSFPSPTDEQAGSIWAGLGKGSDVAAELQGMPRARR